MAIADAVYIDAWREVLELSRLQPGEIVTVLTSTNSNEQSVRCSSIAAQMLGATVSRLDLFPVNGERALSRDALAYLGTTPLTGNRSAIAGLKASDLVIDLMTLLFSNEQIEILRGGTKILLAVEPPEILTRMLPTISDRERVCAAKAMLEGASEMRVVSSAGTQMHFDLGDFPVIGEYGFVDEPGRWDHWPSGFVFTFANEGSANGVFVIDSGDILLPQKSYVREPITVEMRDGYATSITGGFEAEMLREYMASFEDGEAYALSHIGWGLQPRAKWSTLGLYDREQTIGMDARAVEGNFLFSLGPNNEAGGSRVTACHMDIPLRNCSVYLDDEPVVVDGSVVRDR